MEIMYNLVGGPMCLWTESRPNLKGILDWRLFCFDGEDAVFWDMTPCNMEIVFKRFRGIAFVVYLFMLKSYVNTTHKHTKASFKIESPAYLCIHWRQWSPEMQLQEEMLFKFVSNVTRNAAHVLLLLLLLLLHSSTTSYSWYYRFLLICILLLPLLLLNLI